MEDMKFNLNNYDSMTLPQLADIRAQGIERVDAVTNSLKQQVKVAHNEGVNIQKIARQAGVTRPTIYSWLAE